MTNPDRAPTVDQQDVDATRQDATVGVVEATQALGVTVDAVRARALKGRKEAGEWLVHIRAGAAATGH